METITMNLGQLLDMTELYRTATSTASKFGLPCPVIISNQEIGNYDFLYLSDSKQKNYAIALSKKLNSKQELKIIEEVLPIRTSNIYYINDDWELFNDVGDMYYFYSLACALSDTLKMRCPIIALQRTLPYDLSGVSCNEDKKAGKTLSIHIAQDENLEKMLKTLVHEMRHAWQHHKYPEKYFKNYRFIQEFDKENDLEYFLQPAEIDAEIYAWRVMKDIFNLETINVKYPEVEKIILEQRDKKMPGVKYSDSMRDFADVWRQDLMGCGLEKLLQPH